MSDVTERLTARERVDPLSYELGRLNERVKRIEWDRMSSAPDKTLESFYLGFFVALIAVWIFANRRRDEASELDLDPDADS